MLLIRERKYYFWLEDYYVPRHIFNFHLRPSPNNLKPYHTKPRKLVTSLAGQTNIQLLYSVCYKATK